MSVVELALKTHPVSESEAMAHFAERQCGEDHPTLIHDGPSDWLAVSCPYCEPDLD